VAEDRPGEHGRWRRIGRVAKGEVENGAGAAFGLETGAFLEHFPDPGGALELPADAAGDAHWAIRR